MKPISLFERTIAELESDGLLGLAEKLRRQVLTAFDPKHHRDLIRWQNALSELPNLQPTTINLRSAAVTAIGQVSQEARACMKSRLMEFHPWRKGPFDLYGIRIDTEWRSDLKWSRLKPHLDLAGKCILDVGSGNGYYGYRMLGAGAKRVIGIDPFMLYCMQFLAVHKLLGEMPNIVFPASDQILSEPMEFFDIVFSMGVLYHRRSPLDHLLDLRKSLRSGGQLVVESLIVDDDTSQVLVPEDRYAKMRNVWFIPSNSMLERWLRRTGFRDVRIVDTTPTAIEEQRRTEWMTFESLPDFLDPADPRRTLEGYPGPVRSIAIATSP